MTKAKFDPTDPHRRERPPVPRGARGGQRGPYRASGKGTGKPRFKGLGTGRSRPQPDLGKPGGGTTGAWNWQYK